MGESNEGRVAEGANSRDSSNLAGSFFCINLQPLTEHRTQEKNAQKNKITL